jgi:transcription initiation factor TFIIIB Brf1 subunit/transcription initiation factor TFIIB
MRRWYMREVPRCKACRKTYLVRYEWRKKGYCAKCNAILEICDWVDQDAGARLVHEHGSGWKSYTWPSGDLIEYLSPRDVVEWVNDKDYHFVPSDEK